MVYFYIAFALKLVFALIFMVTGILTLMGKLDGFIGCLNKPSAEQYNVKRVRLIEALKNFGWAAILMIFAFLGRSLVAGFFIGVVLLALFVVLILKKTWAKRL